MTERPGGTPTTGVTPTRTATPSATTGATPTAASVAIPTADLNATATGATPTGTARADAGISAERTQPLVNRIRSIARPLTHSSDLDPLMERIGKARYVLLGEASHGTSEYYEWRARISQRLIRERGFSFIAVEGEWRDCYRVNRYVKGWQGASALSVLNEYDRWPSWMWANREVAQLAEWLRLHNNGRAEDQKVGFYGLDVYGLWDSLKAVLEHLERVDPGAVPVARRAYTCFEPYAQSEEEYAGATQLGSASCRDEVVSLLAHLRGHAREYRRNDPESFFDAEQNALVVKNAESYYRAAAESGPASWNLRDNHMADTLDRLMQRQGPRARGIVWAHNTHVGDARATEMADAGMVNIGQLVRERHGHEDVALVGFGSHRGTVIAASHWGGQAQRMTTPPAREGSYEDAFHAAGTEDKLLIFSDSVDQDPLLDRRGHRAIGVVYNPEYEAYGNYVSTELAKRYDAFLYIDQTQALHPLRSEPQLSGERG